VKTRLKFLLAMLAVFVPLRGMTAAESLPVKVLLIGDSLSVGGFGDGMQESLLRKYGAQNVAIFASCGSSPEDWLKGDFVTNCGYRQTTPRGSLLYDYHDGKRPRPVKTPKLRKLVGLYRPEIVIVQLGTNWMDALAETSAPDAGRYRGIITEFVRELRRGNPAVKVFWVLPPSSAKYPARVHAEVEQWINDASRQMGFFTVNSRTLTGAYRAGRSGGDGVHYTEAAGRAWARGVSSKITTSLKGLALVPASSIR
jgi:lysophospholipase L1-like esterase